MSSRWGQHVPRSHPTHLCSACIPSGHSASSLPHPVDSSARKFTPKLVLCSLPLALGPQKMCLEQPLRTTVVQYLLPSHPQPPFGFTSPGSHSHSGARTSYFLGRVRP